MAQHLGTAMLRRLCRPDVEEHSDMRVYMNCQPDGPKVYGFTADWGDSGERATVDFVQPDGPAEFGQLKVGDDILVINGQTVYSLDKVHRLKAVNDAMQSGSVMLSIRRYGTNDNDVSSPPARSTINVTSQDHGSSLSVCSTTSSISPRSPTLSVSSKLISEPEPIQASIDTISHTEPPQQEVHHDSFPMSVQNQMRRSEFFGIPGNHLENGEGTDKKDVHQERNLKLHRQKGSEQDDYGEMNMSMDSTQDRDMSFRSQTDTMEDRVPRLESRRTSGDAGDAVQDQRGSQVSPETKARPWTRISSTTTESHEYRQARDPLVRQRPTGLLAQRLLEDATSQRVSDLKSTPVSMEPRSAELRSHREKDRQSAALQKSHLNTERESLVGHKSLVKVESSSAVQERNKVIQEMRKAAAVQRDSSWIRINELSGKGLSYHSKRSTIHADDQSWIQRRSEMSLKERPRSVAVELSNLRLNSEDMGLRRTNSSDNLDMIHPISPEPSPSRVAGRKECCACKEPIGRGAAMFIESLKAFFHLDCFKCGVCHKVLSKSGSSIDVRLQQGILHCKDCCDNSMDVAHFF